MSFELDSTGADQLDELASTQGVPFGTHPSDAPGFFSGSLTAGAKGLARGLVAKPALLLGDAVTPALRAPARAVDKALGTSLDDWLTSQQRKNRQALDDLRPDPLTTGFAGQALGGLFDLGSSALAFSPEGAAVLEGNARRAELIDQGVDANTATGVGVVTGAATLLGVKAPMTLGAQAATRGTKAVAQGMAYGAGLNVASGVADRGASHEILARAGYTDQAALLEPFDRQAMLAEAVLGSLFSGGATALEARSTVKGQKAADAALALRSAQHGTLDTAPGLPADAKALAAHRTAMDMAMGQVLSNERVDVGGTVDGTSFVLRKPQRRGDAVQEQVAHVADLLPDAPSFVPPANAARGIQNHNPGNIEASREHWQGQTGNDGRFVTFATPEAGIRALGKTLLAYQDKHGLNTVAGIVERWAPTKENGAAAHDAYVREVSKAIGFEPTTPLNLRDPQTLQRLTTAIIHHENGAQPYPESMVRAGVEQALGMVGGDPAAKSNALRTPRLDATTTSARDVGEQRPPELAQSQDMSDSRVPEDISARPSESQTLAEPTNGSSASPWPSTGESAAAAPRFPRASELEPMRVGPGVIEPREIAAGLPLYRETSTENLGDLLMHDGQAHVRDMFVADNRDLAIGQGANKGVQIEFREGSLSGREHIKPGTGPVTGREYRTDMVAPRALQAFTVPKDFSEAKLRVLARRALPDFTRQDLADGRIRYERKTQPEHMSDALASAEATPEDASAMPTQPEEVDGMSAQASRPHDPVIRAAAEVAASMPDLRVVLEDGTELTASEVLARAQAERQLAQQESAAFDAAVNCFLRS